MALGSRHLQCITYDGYCTKLSELVARHLVVVVQGAWRNLMPGNSQLRKIRSPRYHIGLYLV